MPLASDVLVEPSAASPASDDPSSPHAEITRVTPSTEAQGKFVGVTAQTIAASMTRPSGISVSISSHAVPVAAQIVFPVEVRVCS